MPTKKAKVKTDKFVFDLYITGASPNSIKAVSNITQICEDHLQGRYLLKIIDVYLHKALAEQAQLIALPMLVKRFPLPERKLIGDLSNTEKVIKLLGLAS